MSKLWNVTVEIESPVLMGGLTVKVVTKRTYTVSDNGDKEALWVRLNQFTNEQRVPGFIATWGAVPLYPMDIEKVLGRIEDAVADDRAI